MASTITAPDGTVFQTEQPSAGVNVPRGKAGWGPDGTFNEVDTPSPMPVQLRKSDGTEIGDLALSALRDALRGTGDKTLSDLDTLLTTLAAGAVALGQGTMAQSIPVAVASDQTQVPVRGNLLGATQAIPARPSNTTAYASGVAYNAAPLTITGITNASPAVVTVAGHGLATGQAINIASVVGATGANGNWLVVVVDANTFTLTDINGNPLNTPGAYTSGGTILLSLTFPGIARVASGRAYIVKARLDFDGLAMAGAWRLYLYNNLITPLADQATFNLLKANRASRVGYLDFTTVTEGAGSGVSFGQLAGGSVGIPLEFQASPVASLYGQLVAKGAATPLSAGEAQCWITSETY